MSHKATVWAIQQRGLKPATKIVLWFLCDRHNPDFGCFPTQARLADDDCFEDAMRRAYQLILRDRLGMVARVSGGTAEALAMMGDEPPDVVIADFNLDNDETGLQAIRALREAAGQPVPAIMVSARRDPEIGRASLELGVPMLEKPIRPEELQSVLQRILA